VLDFLVELLFKKRKCTRILPLGFQDWGKPGDCLEVSPWSPPLEDQGTHGWDFPSLWTPPLPLCFHTGKKKPSKTCIEVRVGHNLRRGRWESSKIRARSLNPLPCKEGIRKDIRFIAELQRAKHASKAPWVRKIGNPSSRENLVMTSAYERANIRSSVQTLGEGEGRLEIFLTATHTGN